MGEVAGLWKAEDGEVGGWELDERDFVVPA